MVVSRKRLTRSGMAATSYAALLVTALLLVLVGFVLGRHTGDSSTGARPPIPPEPGAMKPGVPLLPSLTEHSPDEEADRPVPYEFDPPVLDFGVIQPQTELTGTVKIHNRGEKTIRILKMIPDCLCTTGNDLSGTEIKPGEFAELIIVMEPRSYPGTRRSRIHFAFQGHAPGELVIRSTISKMVRAEPSYLKATDAQDGFFWLLSLDERPFSVLAVDEEEPVYANDFDPERDEPRNKYLLYWDISGYDPQTCENAEGKRLRKWWVVETDHPEAPLIDIRMRHFPCTTLEVPDVKQGQFWLLSEHRVMLGEIPADESAEFTIYMRWLRNMKPDDTVRLIESESDQFHASLLSQEKEGDSIRCRVRIIPDRNYRGLIYGVVRFHSHHPGHSYPVTVIAKAIDPPQHQAAVR